MLTTGILKKAIKEAKKSNMKTFRIGAVIFKGNRIISNGHNYKGFCGKIHPRYRNQRDTVHAEQDAIIKYGNWEKLKGSSILTIRVGLSGKLSMSRPCEEICIPLIKHVGIKEMFYSIHSGEIIMEEI